MKPAEEILPGFAITLLASLYDVLNIQVSGITLIVETHFMSVGLRNWKYLS